MNDTYVLKWWNSSSDLCKQLYDVINPFLEQLTQDILRLYFIIGTENSECLYSLDMVDTTLYYTILQYMPEELFDACNML